MIRHYDELNKLDMQHKGGKGISRRGTAQRRRFRG